MITELFIFRNDLRINDNTAFEKACESALSNNALVLAVFILNPEQLLFDKNSYASNNAIQFMYESLIDLNDKMKGKLHLLYGENLAVLDSLFKLKSLKSLKNVWVNNDYTPYSRKRDSEIEKLCQQYSIKFNGLEDRLLQPVGSVRPKTGSPIYLKFTPFFTSSSKLLVRAVSDFAYDKVNDRVAILTLTLADAPNILFKTANDLKKSLNDGLSNSHIPQHGGRDNVMKVIDDLPDYDDYEETRDYPDKKTTQLSAHIKFGTISIRELYWHIYYTLGDSSVLIKQLYWRDFYYNIAWITDDFKKSMKPKYDKIVWVNDPKLFEAWKNGLTGFPLIDAGMRELNTTGYMHNRTRMATANFLVKLLGIDWRYGEKYFAQKLYDYDPAINNGNWQWVAGLGADAQPYFRIFNPWLQSEKFDKDCKYIKKWCPELQSVPNNVIHQWDKHYKNYISLVAYPSPCIDYEKAREQSLELYKGL